MQQFSSWYPLTDAGVDEHAPTGPAAIQVRRADGLVDYPSGKSAMVGYFYSDESAAESLREHFEDELEEPGTRGEGELEFRYIEGTDEAKDTLAEVLYKFVNNFGKPPIFNRYPDE